LPLKAIILAAGEGTRLRPITETRPKALIPILCKPIIRWHVEALLPLVDEVIIVVGYKSDLVVKYLETSGLNNSKIRFVKQEKLLGTGDAVLKAIKVLDPDDEAIVSYSDVFLEDWSIFENLRKISGNIVVGVRVSNPRDYGVLVVEGGVLKHIVEKPEHPESNIVNAGIYKLRVKDVIDNSNVSLSPRGEVELTSIVSKMANSSTVRVYEYSGKWIDIGKPWHVIEANKIALSRMTGMIKGRVKDPVHIEGNVYIDEDAEIKPFTVIEGPVYIGKGAVIGPHAYIRPWSVICENAKIGFSVEVKESVIMESVHASHLAYIGDSVICEGVNLGAGTILANLRFDEKPVKMLVKGVLEDTGRVKLGSIIGAYVRTGINVSIMPGVKIGSYSWILPGVVVYRDVPSNTIYPQRSIS
jgi:bifunctional UDP-N-acetylglucosamine pyrophosphorylase/glucosamine-1-phosphate N-acetyltransferase